MNHTPKQELLPPALTCSHLPFGAALGFTCFTTPHPKLFMIYLP